MYRTEVEFCRQHEERLLQLAQQCVSTKIRHQIAMLANEWADRAKAKESVAGVSRESA